MLPIRLKYLIAIFLIIFGYLFLCFYTETIVKYNFCVFKQVTGIPCPACGSTRATLQLIQGNLGESILINPFALLTNSLIVISFFWMIIDVAKNTDSFISYLKKDWNIKYKILVVIIIVSNWIWNIQKGI
jgi:hypothetical protein